MLQNLLTTCKTRETFDETGKWVRYPQALEWALRDFERSRLESWIIRYPLVGFNQIMRWYNICSEIEHSDPNVIEAARKTKLLYYIACERMSRLLVG